MSGEPQSPPAAYPVGWPAPWVTHRELADVHASIGALEERTVGINRTIVESEERQTRNLSSAVQVLRGDLMARFASLEQDRQADVEERKRETLARVKSERAAREAEMRDRAAAFRAQQILIGLALLVIAALVMGKEIAAQLALKFVGAS